MIERFRQEETEFVEPMGFDDYDLRLGDVMRGERATLGKSLLDVQRELKVKASYIAAIENSDPSAFETPGFIAGYVRSYARYLGLDAEWAFKTFCAESGFATAHGMSKAASPGRPEVTEATPFGTWSPNVRTGGEGFLARIEVGAIASVIVLLGLIGVLGYGGYAVLTEIQRVQLVPVEQAPTVAADIDPLDRAPRPDDDRSDPAAEMASGGFDRLYRPEALEVPVLVARDGPIAALDPRLIGAFASETARRAPEFGALAGLGPHRDDGDAETRQAVMAALGQVVLDMPAPEAGTGQTSPQVVADNAPEVVVFAVRPSWVRIRSAEGTTIYEKIMNEGDRFVLPKTEEAPTLRTGESGAIYFSVNGVPYGPAGRPGAVTGGLVLAAEALTDAYQVADLTGDTALARVVVELRADPPQRPGQRVEPGID